MQKLKKKINIILFTQCLKSQMLVLFIPSLVTKTSDKNFFILFKHGIKYILNKNTILRLGVSNISYMFFNFKHESIKHLTLLNSVFFGLKIKNIYFPAATLRRFNYIKFFQVKTFLARVRFILFYFWSCFLVLKKKFVSI